MPEREPGFADRVEARPSFDSGRVRQTRRRDLGYRFLAGAATSVAAGLVTIAFGARVGGILLAFPAILAASLTLIEEQEDSVEAREDARGAVLGGCAMALFALVAALALGTLSDVVALLLATVAWFAGALTAYLLVWFR